MEKSNLTRRGFLGTTAAGAGLTLAGFTQAAPAQSFGPNDTIRIGVVGPGGRGTHLLDECVQYGRQYGARVTAACDIWNRRREAATERLKKLYDRPPKVYKHIEPLLEDKDVDAVIIATADHQHAKMLKMAVEAGKDVYCEKPMANVLEEGNATLAAVQRTDRIVQIGTQRRSFPKYRQAEALMRQGVVGDIVKVEIISNAYSPYRWAKSSADLASVKESDVDWKAFLMGKPNRPFDPRIYRSFRLFKDFSSGIIDQWMTHAIDAVHMLTGQSYPLSAVAHGGIYKYQDYRENPDTIQVALEYGHGEKRFLATYAVSLINGAGKAWRVMGTKGTLEVEDGWRLSGAGIKSDVRISQAQEIPDAPNTLHHMANWFDCVRRRYREGIYCPAEAGYGHSVACILSTDALWSGQRKLFDPKKQTIRDG